jgi:hypothetical protein
MFSFVKFTLSLNVMLVKVTIDPDDTWLDDQFGIHPWQDKERKVGHEDKDQTTAGTIYGEGAFPRASLNFRSRKGTGAVRRREARA